MRQLRRIIREAVFDPNSMPVIKDDRTEDNKNKQQRQSRALYDPPPEDMDSEEAALLRQYRREWNKLRKNLSAIVLNRTRIEGSDISLHSGRYLVRIARSSL